MKEGLRRMARSFPVTRSRRVLFSAGAALLLATPAMAQKKVKVFGFYPSFDLTPALTNGQLDGITHVIFFSVRMPTDGRLTDTYVSTQTNGQKLVDIIGRGASRGVKVLLAIGGWELSAEFAGVAGDANRRKAFAQTAAQFCKDNGLAGIDIDWEFPTGHQANLALLLDEINLTFKPAGLMLTMSVNGEAPQYYGASALNKTDFILIMAYDMGTPHSTYNHAVSAVGAYAGQVTQKSKLVLGMPFYGKSGGATRTYAELLQMNPNLSPSANDYSGYNFNGPNLIEQKSSYIVDQGGGGTMIWQISQDAVTGAAPKGVLLTAMNSGFSARGATLDKAPLPIGKSRRRVAFCPLRRERGVFSLSDKGLTPGIYQLTLFTAPGKALAVSRTRLASSQNELRWPLEIHAGGPLFYRVEDATRTLAIGATESQ
jgi:hypothetical protein